MTREASRGRSGEEGGGMSNRHERRKAAKLQCGQLITIDYGRLLERDQNYGLLVGCYVCEAVHKALGLARITHNQSTTDVPLCEVCLSDSDRGNSIIRKYTKAPDLKIDE